jgi:hypothetical protein
VAISPSVVDGIFGISSFERKKTENTKESLL